MLKKTAFLSEVYFVSHRLVYSQIKYTVWCNIKHMKNIKSNFSENLRILMGEMSISEFAEKVGIPQQTISRYLLCQREISISNLWKIADYFDESIDFLKGRKD